MAGKEEEADNKNLHLQLDEFINKFETEGPGVEEDMDKGQKLMEAYAVEYEKLEATRLEMGKSASEHSRESTFASLSALVCCF